MNEEKKKSIWKTIITALVSIASTLLGINIVG